MLLLSGRRIRARPGGELGRGEKGDATPHLFRAAPEGNINFTFLAMT